MTQPLFIVRVADLERGKKHYEWEIPPGWLRRAFDGTDASVETPGKVALEASITARQVILRGSARADVTMPCARTLDPVPVELVAEIFSVLRPAAAAHEGARSAAGSEKKKSARAVEAPNAAPAPKRHQAVRPEAELSEDEAAEDVYHGDQIELDELIRECLLLELPMMPLRSDLRSEERPAIPPTPETPEASESPPTVDPRLRPLAEIASRLRKTTKE